MNEEMKTKVLAWMKENVEDYRGVGTGVGWWEINSTMLAEEAAEACAPTNTEAEEWLDDEAGIWDLAVDVTEVAEKWEVFTKQ